MWIYKNFLWWKWHCVNSYFHLIRDAYFSLNIQVLIGATLSPDLSHWFTTSDFTHRHHLPAPMRHSDFSRQMVIFTSHSWLQINSIVLSQTLSSDQIDKDEVHGLPAEFERKTCRSQKIRKCQIMVLDNWFDDIMPKSAAQLAISLKSIKFHSKNPFDGEKVIFMLPSLYQ